MNHDTENGGNALLFVLSTHWSSGSKVMFDRSDDRQQTFRIVGEDEVDAARGTVSHVSPLARALLGRPVGDTAVVAGGHVEIVAAE